MFASIPNFTEFYSEDINKGMECIRLLNEIIGKHTRRKRVIYYNIVLLQICIYVHWKWVLRAHIKYSYMILFFPFTHCYFRGGGGLHNMKSVIQEVKAVRTGVSFDVMWSMYPHIFILFILYTIYVVYTLYMNRLYIIYLWHGLCGYLLFYYIVSVKCIYVEFD